MARKLSTMFEFPGMQSPILKTSIELLIHAFEHYAGGSPRDYRLCVLHLAHSAELAIKAALVERNQTIYLSSARTLDIYAAMGKLKNIRQLKPEEDLPFRSKIDLVIDERNAIQHRYGTINEITMRYLLEGAFCFMNDLLSYEFDIDLRNYLQVNLNDALRSTLSILTHDVNETIIRINDLLREKPPMALLELKLLLEDKLFDISAFVKRGYAFKPIVALKLFSDMVSQHTVIEADYAKLAEQLDELYQSMVQEDHVVLQDEVKPLLALIKLFDHRESFPDYFHEACNRARRKIIAGFPGGNVIISDAEVPNEPE